MQTSIFILNAFKVIDDRHQRQCGPVRCVRHLDHSPLSVQFFETVKIAVNDLAGAYLILNGFANVSGSPFLKAGELGFGHVVLYSFCDKYY